MQSATDVFYAASTGGFYTPEVHGTAIPGDAVLITADQHRALIAATADGATISGGPDGYPVANWPAPPTDAEALATAREQAERRMMGWIEAFLAQFTKGVPAAEIASWPLKAAAAAAHLAGQPQPIIIAEAMASGEDPDELATYIDQKAGPYTKIIAATTGLRRATVREISQAETPEAVTAALRGAHAKAAAMIADLGLVAPEMAVTA